MPSLAERAAKLCQGLVGSRTLKPVKPPENFTKLKQIRHDIARGGIFVADDKRHFFFLLIAMKTANGCGKLIGIFGRRAGKKRRDIAETPGCRTGGLLK